VATQRMHSAVSTGLGCLAFVALAAYLFYHRSQFSALQSAGLGVLSFGVVGSAGILAADGLLNLVMLRRLGIPITWQECVSLSSVATAWNLVAPARAGAAVRAVYLKKVYGFGYSRFLSTLLGFYVLTTLVLCSAALGSLIWLRTIQQRETSLTLEVTAAVCVLVCLLAAFLPATERNDHWLAGRLAAMTHGWQVLRSEPRTLLSLLCLASVQIAAGLLTLWACYRALGVVLGPAEIIAVGALGAISTLFGITPGSWGIYEAVVAFVADTLGVTPAHSVAAAVLSRLMLVTLLLPLASIGAYHLAHCRRLK